MTFNNRAAFTEHQRMVSELQSVTYFEGPFARWQRGLNGIFNGLLRQYIPKKQSISKLTQDEIKMIESI